MKEKDHIAGLPRRVENALDLPVGVLTAAPRIEFSGNRRALIEGCESILEYNEDCIRLRTAIGVIRLSGRELCLHCRTSEHAVITGRFLALEFL